MTVVDYRRKRICSIYWPLTVALLQIFFLSKSVWGAIYINHLYVSLSWTTLPESDLRGYEIHRATSSGGPYQNRSGIITTASWTDSNVVDGGTYYYEVRAVDLCGNYSQLSSPSDAAIIDVKTPTVTATPPGGRYSQTGNVSLTPSEPATIYYTTDGSTPTANSSVYSAPIPISQDTTLRYFGVDRAKNQSPVLTSTYTLGSSLGLITVKSPNGGEVYRKGQMGIITWTSLFGVGNSVKIALFRGGVFNRTITPMTNNDGMYLMIIPETAVPGVDYQIRVASASNPAFADISDGYFTINASLASAADVMGTADDSPPYVDPLETYPYYGQGLIDNQGSADRVPIDTGIVIRVIDNVGVDETSVKMAVNGRWVPIRIVGTTGGDPREIDIVYGEGDGFGFDEVVVVDLSLSDLAGNLMEYSETFRVESEQEHQWAFEHTPSQTVTDLGDGTCEVSIVPQPDAIEDEMLEGTKLIYNCSEATIPRFGPVSEIPALDIADPLRIPINIEPMTVFNSPVTLVIPLPDAELADTNNDGVFDSGLEKYRVYQYSPEPTAHWRDAANAPGWMVRGSMVSHHYETVPPEIEIHIQRPGATQVGIPFLP